jgi:Tfp pilus assembly protein PilV
MRKAYLSRRRARGFSLLETFIALILVAIAMTALVLAFGNSGKYGVLSRRQATAVMVARSLVEQMNGVAFTDTRLVNSNVGNDTTFADPNGLFANAVTPTSANAPDTVLGTVKVGTESYDAFLNVAYPNDTDAFGGTANNVALFAVIVRYKVGSQYMRAVALGGKYNPNNMALGGVPLPL